ncbi:hypothetical protein E4U42_004496 [Claviceps africana]|uniref:Uncharacterized protein n=1 Tax=Claviceps africana TaxID=83212 RepID=A0A8K0NG53_9HYPO|nr:hypothetical protein E4U42_004496 [Claviceps africana]
MSNLPPKSAGSSDLSLLEKTELRECAQVSSQDAHVETVIADKTQSDDPPDGGARAWRQVLAGHLILFNTSGYILSFGIFQPYYHADLPVFLIGAPAGWAFDAGYSKALLGVGSVFQVGGILATSFGREYWQIFLSQGLCSGLASGIIFAPGMANVATYFSKRRNLAISMATCGATTGGIAYSLMARELLPKIGFGWTVRSMGLVVLVNSVMICLLTTPRLPPRKPGPMLDREAFKDKAYVLFATSMFFVIWTAY